MRRLLPAESRRRLLLPVLLVLCLAGCATAQRRTQPAPAIAAESDARQGAGALIAALASAQLGQPYRFGGDSPQGFDCSGLALFVHERAGVALPRTALLQRQKSLPLDRSELLAGDLVFFTMGPRLLVDHVGIYVGGGQFVHAPRAGSPVRLSRLDERGYARHFAGGGRYWSAVPISL